MPIGPKPKPVEINADPVAHSFPYGLTVRELKESIIGWPETNEYDGEECQVWLTTGVNLSAPAIGIAPLNRRTHGGKTSADLLFESSAFA